MQQAPPRLSNEQTSQSIYFPPTVETRFSWIVNEGGPYDSTLEGVGAIQDEVEVEIRGWLGHPEEERKRERRVRPKAARREAESCNTLASIGADEADTVVVPAKRAGKEDRLSGLAYSCRKTSPAADKEVASA